MALVQSSFRVGVALSSAFLLLWIGTVGLSAIVANPYLIAAVWVLGLGGVFVCAGACISTFPSPGQGEAVPHPVRAILCLGGGASIGLVLWAQARPAMEGEPLGLEVFGAVLAGAVILGMVLLVLMSFVLLVTEGEEEARTARRSPSTPTLDLTTRERVA